MQSFPRTTHWLGPSIANRVGTISGRTAAMHAGLEDRSLKGWTSAFVVAVAVVCAVSTGQMAASASASNRWEEFHIGGKSAGDIFPDQAVAQLAQAACVGDEPTIARLVGAGTNPNASGFEGATPLFWALQCESVSGVGALLEHGANPNQMVGGEAPFSAVFSAAGRDDPAFLRLLLSHGGNPNAFLDDGGDWTALKAAFFRGNEGRGWENWNALLDAGADINAVHHGATIAQLAALLNSFDRVDELLRRGYRHDLDDLQSLIEVEPSPHLASEQRVWRDKVLSRLRQLRASTTR